jgi:hypothetical protein
MATPKPHQTEQDTPSTDDQTEQDDLVIDLVELKEDLLDILGEFLTDQEDSSVIIKINRMREIANTL